MAGPLLLILILAGALLYRHQTRPELVWSRARSYLEQLTGGEVTIGQASFSLFGGVRLSRVGVSLPPDSGFCTATDPPREREVFRVDELHLRTNLVPALLGKQAIEEIVASQAVFTLVRRTRDGHYNWQRLLALRSPEASGRELPLPEIRLRDAKIRLRKLGRDSLADLDTIELNVWARPTSPSAATYAVRWHQRGENSKSGLSYVRLDRPGFDAGTDGLPTMNVETVLAAMPGDVEAFSEWLALLDLHGRLGVEALTVGESGSDEAAVRLEGLSLAVPLDEGERHLPPEQRLLRLDRVNGTLRWSAGRIEAEVGGRLNGQPCRLEGTLFVPAGAAVTWAEVGFDLRLAVEKFDLPLLTDDPADRSASLVRRFEPLRYLCQRYDPHGSFGVELTVHRDAQADSPVRLVRCVVTAKGADAEYALFPVRLTDLHGELVYTADGVTINDLTGRYGSGTVVVNGHLAQVSPTSGVDLIIAGTDIPLDEPLRAALQPKYRDIWERFAPQGRVHTRIRLFREDRPSRPTAPFRSTVEVEFLGVEARFADLPYPLREVRGRVVAGPTGTRVETLTARRGDTRMTAKGAVVPDHTGRSVLDLNLQVEDLAIDRTLVDCLPPAAREAIGRFELTGRADLAGKILTDPRSGRIVFDMRGRLAGGTACPERIPLFLTGVEGAFRVRPERVDLLGWRGQRGRSTVEVEGTFWLSRTPSQQGRPWRVRCAAVQLDEELRAALPPSWVKVWDQVGASGRLDVEVEYHQDRPAAGDAYRATLTARGVGLCFERFGWPVEEVTGQVVVTPSQVELIELRGRHEDAEVRAQGLYDRPTGAAIGSLDATNVALEETLRLALPWRLRRRWNVVQPSGRIDLHLDRLVRSVDGEGRALWSCQGGVELRGAGLEAGASLAETYGRLQGSGRYGPQGDWTADATLHLDRCTLNGHRLGEVRGRLSKTHQPSAWDLTDLTARVHGGRAMGRAHIDQQPGGGYEFSLVARDMSLGPFLVALAGDRQVPETIYGKASGQLYYSARFDRPQMGRGGGELSVSGGALFRTPFMLSVLRVLDPVPAVGNYQDASLRFYLSREQLDLHSIFIRDRSLAMTGSGTLSLPSKNLNLSLLVGQPSEQSSPLTAIPEFIQGALQELVEIRVVGDPARPRIQARPLRGLDEAVRILAESRKGFRR